MTATVAARGDPEAPVIHRAPRPGPGPRRPAARHPRELPRRGRRARRPSPTTPRADPGAVAPAQLAIGCRRMPTTTPVLLACASSTTPRCSRPATSPCPMPSARPRAAPLGLVRRRPSARCSCRPPRSPTSSACSTCGMPSPCPARRRPPPPRARRPARCRPRHHSAALAAPALRLRVRVVGAELGGQEGWHGLPAVSARPRDAARSRPCRGLRRRAQRTAQRPPRHAKFPTGPTPAWPWPDEAELRLVPGLSAAPEVPFKLTRGLHHAGARQLPRSRACPRRTTAR